MTRANAANEDAWPDMVPPPIRETGPRRGGPAVCERPGVRRPAPEIAGGALARFRFLPSAASIGVAFAVIGVIALTLQHLQLEHDLALRTAAREVDMRATILAERLDAALSAAPRSPAAEVVRRVLDAHPEERLDETILVDGSGRRIAFDATEDASGWPLTRVLSESGVSPGAEEEGVAEI